ncbi:putative serine/threonine-protein kinase [Cynara cardunculus var. scolymus]|uniref:putative serine/threonine-protein kinase n=1 Tax=Cynara cardunculus var. scolymus TaxID=59895 RepID=UPI000D625439|nr:putative serine/threonine-protein kinase [Cynara cardunculus var. scolymus]XP_024974525.1 putative serine/threonine-protein kinase [Cynara cardunculus var. scolymus]
MGIGCFGAFDSCKARSGKTPDEIATNNVKQFSYNSLRSATRNFHPSNKIGGGGFGVVYKGILRDDTHVAVKSLSAESKQGTIEFLTEINLISSIQHPNLVQLIGCCIEDGNRILVYEYLENNSLASALLGSRGKHIDLDWATRASICEGTAAGLAFLHEEAEPHIVHRDIKASNVLLDGSFHPKIGDFGLAKLFPDNVTHLSTRVAGTVGYLAPEYALLGQLTKKADVYSFGVLMLEIISGRSSSKAAFSEDLLGVVEWSWKLKDEERLLDVVDPDLTNCPDDEIMRFITVALFCTQAASNQRPSMKQVVEMLTRKVHLNAKLLTEPGIFKARSSCRQSDDGVSVGTTKSRAVNGKQSLNPFVTSLPQVSSSYSISQMLPR